MASSTKRKISKEFEEQVVQALQSGKRLTLLSYAMTEETEKNLDRMIFHLSQYYGRDEETQILLYTCTKELAINGLKANHKRIFFEKNKLDISNNTDYDKGLKLFKQNMNEKMANYFGNIAKKNNIYVRISFVHSLDGIRVEIKNNSGITPQEEKRLREKLSKIMDYDDLLQFYLENADDTEGAGMGLALVITLLKKVGVDPHLFRIIVQPRLTLARLEIPFDKSYKPLREPDRKLSKRPGRTFTLKIPST